MENATGCLETEPKRRQGMMQGNGEGKRASLAQGSGKASWVARDTVNTVGKNSMQPRWRRSSGMFLGTHCSLALWHVQGVLSWAPPPHLLETKASSYLAHVQK